MAGQSFANFNGKLVEPGELQDMFLFKLER